MTIPINISNLITNRTIESSRIEYKENWNPEKVLHSVCAFANDIDNLGGDYIIIGIREENGMPILPISGIDKNSVDKINKELLNLSNLIEPRYIPRTEHVTYDERDILVIWVPGGNERPYKCPISPSSGKSNRSGCAYYIRKLSNTVKANAADEKILLDLSAGNHLMTA